MMGEDFHKLTIEAWNTAQRGDYEKAFALYEEAEEAAKDIMPFSATLNILRHVEGDKKFFDQVKGHVATTEPTEDDVFGLESTDNIQPSQSARGMKKTVIDQDQLEENIRKFHFDASYHLKNIKRFQPHLLVMSTGRCGTMSLYKLLQKTQYMAHHQFYFNASYIMRLEQMCRFMDGNYDNSQVVHYWLQTRAAEWIDANNMNRPVAMVGHHDTIFAPVFAALHMMSGKIIYLRRNPRDVFASMYGKNQFSRQLRPIFYRFGEQWEWKDQNLDLPEQIIWYLKFTEAFSRALGNIISDRWIEIDADKLFNLDDEEIIKLHEFAELDIPIDEVRNHFKTVYNRKAHKDEKVDEGLKLFEEIWDEPM